MAASLCPAPLLMLATVAPGSAGSAGAATPATTSTTALASGLPGRIAYLSDSNNYGSGGRQTLATTQPDGAGRHVLLTTTSSNLGLLAFSPNGQQLAYFVGKSSSAEVVVRNLASGAVASPFKLRTTSAFVTGLAWAPDGRELIVGTNQVPGRSKTHSQSALWRIPLASGTARRLTGFVDAGSPSVMANGDIVYVASKTYSTRAAFHSSTLWLVGSDGSHPQKLLHSTHFLSAPAVSPSGATVAFGLVTTATTSHLESVATTGGATTNLTRLVKGRSDLAPSWSPDGSHLVFLSSRAGRHQGPVSNELMDAYVMSATGAGVTKILGFKGSKQSINAVDWGE